MPANVYDKATYKLHPSFGPKETQGEHGVRLLPLRRGAFLAEDLVEAFRNHSWIARCQQRWDLIREDTLADVFLYQ